MIDPNTEPTSSLPPRISVADDDGEEPLEESLKGKEEAPLSDAQDED